MPWSDQSGGGGWKGGGGGPWGPRPSQSQQPDLEEILRRSQDRLRQAMPGGRMGGPLAILLAVAVTALVGFFGFTVRVNPDELGIVLRFGEYVRQLPPGLNFRWPYPIEQVELPKVTRINRIEIGMRGSSDSRDASSTIRDVPEESLMLTGDENIVDVDFVVFWRIANAPDFLFNIQNPEGTVKAVAESAMREIVGQNDIEPILTEARAKTEFDVQQLMQKVLDSYGAGVQVTQVQLQKVDPPAQVIDAFRDVQADRFTKVYEQYKKAPDVTRQRIFIETMERVLGDSDKVIIDGNAGPGVVPFLPLSEFTTRPAPAQPQEGQP